MDVSEFISSSGSLLKKEDIGKSRPHVEISEVDLTDFGDGDRKIVLRFAGKSRGMALNKTNTQILAAAFGSETDAWIGETVELWVDPYVTFQGKVVGGLKVTPVVSQTKSATVPVNAEPVDPNDDIPF